MKTIQKILASIATNKHLQSLGKMGKVTTLLLIVVTLFLSAVPTMMGKMQRNYQEDFPEIEKTIVEVLTKVDCEITDQTLSCVNYDDFVSNGEYEVSFFTENRELDKSKIVFNKETVLIVHYVDKDNNVSKEMNYSRFTSDFSFIENTEGLNEEEINDLSDRFTYNLYHSTTFDEIVIISFGIVLITIILIIGTSLLFLTINVGRITEKIKFIELFNMILVNYATVLFYASIFALITPTIAQMASAFILIIRLTSSYYYLSSIKNQKKDMNDENTKFVSTN